MTSDARKQHCKAARPSWSQVKAQIKHWDKAQLTGLVQDLFDHSQDNRGFLAARLLRDSIGEQAIAPYLKRIESAFYRKNGWPANRLDLKDARSAIREYQRATSDPAGTLELMLAHVEIGTAFTREFGDISEAFYDSLCSSLQELKKLLVSEEGRLLYPRVKDRLAALARRADGIGWGYGDYVGDVVAELQQELDTQAQPQA
ncbi:MAG: hypothetical protein ACE15C_20880 [Phycisphaerae bacterium]